MKNWIALMLVTLSSLCWILNLDSKLTLMTRNWNRAETRLVQARLQLEESKTQEEHCQDIITECCK